VPLLPEIGVVLGLLVAAFLFARVAHHAGMPAAGAIVLVGIAANGILRHALRIELTPATLAFFLPALIFEGAWSIDVGSLRRTALPIAVLAIPGGFVTAAVVVCAGVAAGGLVLPAAFALGAMLSATDPVAVLALFRTVRIPHDLRTVVEGESIANDGVAVVLVQLAMIFAAGSRTTGAVWLAATYAPIAGILIGVVVARTFDPVMRRFPAVWVGIAGTLAVAYGAYALATFAGASGIFASAAAGIALPKLALDAAEVRAVDRFWDRISLLANAIVFLLVGLTIKFERLFAEPFLLIGTAAAVAVSRAILAYAIVPVPGARADARGWRHVVALAGIRGGLSLALALGLPQDFPDRARIIDAVFGVVFLTLVVQGWALGPMLRRITFDGDA
jgi:CPA1 family monovalent cation:H+ antiporter